MDVPKPLSAVDKNSFAYKTVKDRIPDIITRLVDSLHRYGIKTDERTAEWEVVKEVISHLSRLRYEVMTDKPLKAFESSVPDHELWNSVLRRYIEETGQEPTWFSAPWLYWECYLYRSIQLIMTTAGVPEFDIFENSKRQQFHDSLAAMETLASYTEDSLPADLSTSGEKERLFRQFLQVCLWGNECDLSISGMAENAQKRDPLASLASLAAHVVADDSDQVWAHMLAAGDRAVTVVLDNAGFELFGDLLFADFLLRAGMTTRVTFHGKAMPWFVSDVTRRDLEWTLDQLQLHAPSPALARLGARWRALFAAGDFVFEDHPFWTTCHDYAAMPSVAADLYQALGRSHLVLFKGDLNYRKLVGDRAWPTTTPFPTALRGFRPAPLCSLRLCKADVVVGLQQGCEERLTVDNPEWMVVGKFAVIQADL